MVAASQSRVLSALSSKSIAMQVGNEWGRNLNTILILNLVSNENVTHYTCK